MDALDFPLTSLSLRATSKAQDLSFVALADVARVIEDLSDVVVIGGQMITLHAYRWGLGGDLFRETKDADIGMSEALAKDVGIVERLEAIGYSQRRGGEFIRVLEGHDGDDPQEVAIDVLVPALTSRPRVSRRITARLVTTEVPGLFTALHREPVGVSLSLTRLDGTELNGHIALPDGVATVVLRAFGYQQRRTSTDAEDIWRSCEIAFAAGVAPEDFVSHEEREAVDIVAKAFTKENSPAAAVLGPRMARMRALMFRVLGIPTY